MTIKGISSMATRLVLNDLAPMYESRTGTKVEVEVVGGMDVQRRVEAGEAFDFVVLAAAAIEQLAAKSRVHADTSIDFVHSGMAIAVRAGTPKPPMASGEQVRDAVAGSRVGYSTGPSGKHVVRLLERWGVTPPTVQAPPGVPVATLLARDEVDLGFQQMSELLGMPGIDIVGPLPADIQEITLFRAAVCTASSQPEATQALLEWFASAATESVKRRYGMEP